MGIAHLYWSILVIEGYPSYVVRILRALLRPVLLFCLKHSVKIQDLVESCKIELLAASEREVLQRGEKVNISRLSVVTGLRRREVLRLQSPHEDEGKTRHFLWKVIGRWQDAGEFSLKGGRPRVLSYGSNTSEFHKLVRSVSQDLNPATVLFELDRIGVVEHTPKGVRLLRLNYVPKGDLEAGVTMLTTDLVDLAAAVEENIVIAPDVPNLHLSTEYDRIRPEGVEQLKAWLLREGHELHLRARKEMARFDQDVNPDPNYHGPYVRIVLGTFGRVEPEKSVEPQKVEKDQ